MAESVTFAYDGDPDSNTNQTVRKITITWTSASDGTATGTSKKISGKLLRAITNPGTAAPTADYDIVLTEPTHGTNLLAKAADDLTDRHTTNTEAVELMLLDYAGTPLATSLRPVVCDRIQFDVSNAGDSKEGVCVLYWEP